MSISSGKKGQVLVYGLIFGLVAAVIVSIVDDYKTKRDFNQIGAYSMLLLEKSIDEEKSLFYIGKSAEY